MKQGANFEDVNEIRRLVAAGHSAEDISKTMNIALSCVKAQVPSAKGPQAPPKKKVTKKRAPRAAPKSFR